MDIYGEIVRLRSGSIVFDRKDTTQIPAVAGPWFLAFNAKVSLRPIMNPQDLATAGPSIAMAAKQYGRETTTPICEGQERHSGPSDSFRIRRQIGGLGEDYGRYR
jgi:hypothetical protein